MMGIRLGFGGKHTSRHDFLSLTPMAAKTVGIDFAKLLEIIINNA